MTLRENLLVVLPSKPYHGGASTTAYETMAMIKKKFNREVYCLVWHDNSRPDLEIDPLHIGNVYEFALIGNRTRLQFFELIKKWCNKHNIGHVICKSSATAQCLGAIKKYLSYDVNLIYWASSSEETHYFIHNQRISCAEDMFANNYFHLMLPETGAVETCDTIIPTSELDKRLFEKIFPVQKYKLSDVHWGVHIVPEVVAGKHSPEIDFLFITSDWDRYTRNREFMEKFCDEVEDRTTTAIIGKPYTSYVDHKLLLETMQNSKFLVVPSRYESKSNIIIEMLGVGRNAITSRNVGASYFLDDKCVVENYSAEDFIETGMELIGGNYDLHNQPIPDPEREAQKFIDILEKK